MEKWCAILTSRTSWFQEYVEPAASEFKKMGWRVETFSRHEDVTRGVPIVFLISYFRLVPKDFVESHAHCLVVHESDLPKGRGWAPLFWQILEGKNEIPLVLFKVGEGMDDGPISKRGTIELTGYELHDEIRQRQAWAGIRLCQEFLDEHPDHEFEDQKGEETIFERRTPEDSKLDPRKSLLEQFNQLRIASNRYYPAYFVHGANKYILKIEREELKK